jgi:hypothetical protein
MNLIQSKTVSFFNLVKGIREGDGIRPSGDLRSTKNLVIQVSDKQTICICQSIPPFTNWNKNRPPDPVRVGEIKEYYLKEKLTVVPGIIYAWEKSDDDDSPLQIYDGIHRLLAAKELMTQGQFTFLLCIYKTDDENLIIKDFKALNKSCPVPVLYTEENENLLKRIVCENVVAELCKKYPTFVSPSRKPYKYNFNRDSVLEFLSELEIDWNISGLSTIIIQELSGLNWVAKDFVQRNNINVPKKCDFHNFYLWYLEKSFIKEKLEKSLRNFF